jgi:hypothetical protein
VFSMFHGKDINDLICSIKFVNNTVIADRIAATLTPPDLPFTKEEEQESPRFDKEGDRGS